ncbi:MAG: TlpA family protein disulfide reductase [Pseudomonadales bacterium]|nr:TlpA family protein disulfide reductase [Pseudomonadales bacterium]
MKIIFNPAFVIVISLLVGAATVSASTVKVGEPAPKLELPNLAGTGSVSLEQYKGKVVYLDFWASWCAPCRKSFPHFQLMREELGQFGFEILGVNVDENVKDAKSFLEKIHVDFPILLDPQGNSAETFGLTGMPTSYLIDQQGIVRMVHQGFKEKDIRIIKQKINKLLAR